MKADARRLPVDEGVLDYLSARTGLQFPAARRRDAGASISRLRTRFGIADAEPLVERLRADEKLFDALVAEVTIGETYFFREPTQLDAVRHMILPALVRDRPANAPLRIWSAGCSSGEEAYSLAIILEEEGLSERASILGTDICPAALARARRGEYGRWSLRNVRGGELDRYLTSSGHAFRLVDRLRRRVSFERLNLASEAYPSAASGTTGVDLILCRNVLIYFGPDHVKAVAQRLHASLADGGWLIAGPSDPPLWPHAPLTTVIVPGAILYRRDPEAGSRASQRSGRRPAPSICPAGPGGRDRPKLQPVPAIRPWPARRDSHEHRSARHAMPSPPGPETEEGWLERVRQLSRTDLREAEQQATKALARHPLSPDLHYLRSVLLVALDRHEEAITALRRLLYLDRTLAAAHFALGSLLQRSGDARSARRSFETAYRLCAARPASEALPLCEGESAAGLAEGAKARIAQIRSSGEGR